MDEDRRYWEKAKCKECGYQTHLEEEEIFRGSWTCSVCGFENFVN